MKIPGLPKELNNLCQPALLYLLLTSVGLVIYFVMMMRINSGLGSMNGSYGSIHHYTMMGFIFKLLLTAFWVYLLNYLCKYKLGKKIAWVIVLLPFFILGLVVVGIMCAYSCLAVSDDDFNSLKAKVDNQEKTINEYSKYKGNIQNGVGINTRVVKETALNSKVTGEYEGYNLS